MRLYHFTTMENLEEILETGCLNRSASGVVWLTKNKELTAQLWPGGNQTTVRISVSIINIAHFARDASPEKLIQGARDWYITRLPIPQKLWVDVESFKKDHWGIHNGLSYKKRKV